MNQRGPSASCAGSPQTSSSIPRCSAESPSAQTRRGRYGGGQRTGPPPAVVWTLAFPPLGHDTPVQKENRWKSPK